MSVQGKLPKLLRSSAFWVDLATALNDELVFMRSDLISPQKKFFEARSLTTFEELRAFLQDYYGYFPYTELFYQKTLPAIWLEFSSIMTSYPNRGWRGRSEYDGNGAVQFATTSGTFTTSIAGMLRFSGGGEFLSLPSDFIFDVRRGTILFTYVPDSTDTTKFSIFRHNTLTGAGYLGIQTTGLVCRTDDGTAESSIPFLSTLLPNTSYRIGVRFHKGVMETFVNGVYQGATTPTFSAAGQFSFRHIGQGNTPVAALIGDLSSVKLFVENLSNEDFALEYAGENLNSTSVRLNQPDALAFVRHEADGLGYRIRNRGNRLFYTWVFNKARMEGQVYSLFRDPNTNILLRSLVLPKADRVKALETTAPIGYFSEADDLNLKWNLDTGWSLDETGIKIDQNFLGKNVAFTKHFALEIVLGQTRDDYGTSGFARFTSHDYDAQTLFLQKHLDYLTQEAKYGKSIAEIPHVGVQLRLACQKEDTTARMDPSTRWTTQIQAAFPQTAVDWADDIFVIELYRTVEVYSGATLLFSRSILDVEIERTADFHLLNLMIPALTISPVFLGPGTAGQETTFSTTLTHDPILPGTFQAVYTDINSIKRHMRDDGQGHLYFSDIIPDADHFSGTIDYLTGNLTVLTLLTGQPNRALQEASYIEISYKTGAVLPVSKIKIKNSSDADVVIVDAGFEPKLYFWKPENHFSLTLSIALT